MRYFFNIYVYFSLVFLFFIKHFVLIFLILLELQGDFFICFIYKFNSFVYLSRFVLYISVYSPLFSVNLYLISYIIILIYYNYINIYYININNIFNYNLITKYIDTYISYK